MFSETQCPYQNDLVRAVDAFETRRALPNECLARYALRMAWLDRTRNAISVEELCR